VLPTLGFRRRSQRDGSKLQPWYVKLASCLTRSYSHDFAGVENVLEMTIAAADGNHIVANAYSNPDLFWALRGGGGGYYSGHLQDAFLHPLLYHDPPRQLHQPHPTRTCSRRSSVSPPRSSNTVTEATAVGLSTNCKSSSYHPTLCGRNPGYFHSALRLHALPRGPPDPKIHPHIRRFLEILSRRGHGRSSRLRSGDSSWLLPEEIVKTDEPEQLATELLRVPGLGYMLSCFSPPGKRSGSLRISFSPISLVTGGEVSLVDPESTGLNPAWQNSLVYTTLGTSREDDPNSTQIEAARQLLVQDMKILEGIAPESGTYLNEVSITRPFHTTF